MSSLFKKFEKNREDDYPSFFLGPAIHYVTKTLFMTLNCDFSHIFQPTLFKLLLTQSSFCALSSELDPKGHK